MESQRIAGRYRVESEAGRGGMGAVWLCVDEKLGRQVAVKQVLSGSDGSEAARARALREARSLAALNHRNVVSVYDTVEEDDQLWLVMEYVPGRSLAELLTRDGALSPEDAVRIGSQIADGLAAAHERGITHRDVKPANILVTEEGVAKISDFGIARMLEDTRLTRTGLVTGTPSYFAPEMARGEEPTPAADVWALGATLYAAVEGHGLYPQQDNALAMLNEIASRQPPRPERAAFLTEPLGRALDPDPASRWSMADLAHVLHRLEAKHAVTNTRVDTAGFAPAPNAEPTTRTQESVAPEAPARTEPRVEERRQVPTAARPRRRRGLAVLVVVALLVIAAGAGLLLLDRDDGDGTNQAGNGAQTDTNEDSSSGDSNTGATDGAEQFVDDYYAALPEDTKTGWSSLTPDFQDEVGSYGDYRGFWSTISDVQVTEVSSAGDGAVDVSLTYVDEDGVAEDETRRIYLERSGDSYLISGDEVR